MKLEPESISYRSATDLDGSVVRVGSDYGGWHFVDVLTPDSVALCFGAGQDITFDMRLIEHTACQVHCFDPTPRAVGHVNEVVRLVKNGTMPLSRYKNLAPTIVDRFSFRAVGLWSETKTMEFFVPPSEGMASYSISNIHAGKEKIALECETFSDICSKLGIEEIDLVKIDIEGAEYEAIDSILASGILPKQLLVEFDEGWKPLDSQAIDRIQTTINKLDAAGYLVSFQEDWNLCFIKP